MLIFKSSTGSKSGRTFASERWALRSSRTALDELFELSLLLAGSLQVLTVFADSVGVFGAVAFSAATLSPGVATAATFVVVVVVAVAVAAVVTVVVVVANAAVAAAAVAAAEPDAASTLTLLSLLSSDEASLPESIELVLRILAVAASASPSLAACAVSFSRRPSRYM